jgi:cellulose synthase (UDP-forming)
MTYASGITLWEAILPSLIIVLFAFALLPWLDRNNNLVRSCAIGVCLFLSWRYMFWRLQYTLPPVGLTLDYASGIIFVAVELLALIGSSASLFFLTRTRNRSAEVERNLPWVHSLRPAPTIDVLICTYNENEKILERTIIGALAIDYPNYRLWVCDDGKRKEIRALCDRLGCGYITREDNAHAKAGNINNALRHLQGLPEPPSFVSILDADFVPKPAFLARALSLMREKDVGIVQTPQHFFNPDPIQTNLSLTRVWPDEQRYFFDVVMPSKDAWYAAFCCGTSSLIRFSSLMGIGGFPTESVTEDYLLTLRLQRVGYRTVYLDEVLSVGLAPEGLKEYISQRSRWALGFVQICQGASGPLRLGNGLRLVDRVMLIETFLYWSVTYCFRLLGIIIPFLYLLFNIQSVYANVSEAILYFLPYFVAQIAVAAWVSQGRVMPIMSDLSQLLCADAILKSVASALFATKAHKFKVTAKGRTRDETLVQWSLLTPFVIYLVLTGAGVLWAFVLDDSRPLADASGVALLWSWYNIVVLVLACIVAIEASDRRISDRFAVGRTARLNWHGRTHDFLVSDISVSGMLLSGRLPAPVGSTVHVTLGNLEVDAKIVRGDKAKFALKFCESQNARANAIRHVYGGSYTAAVSKVKPVNVVSAVIGRVFR